MWLFYCLAFGYQRFKALEFVAWNLQPEIYNVVLWKQEPITEPVWNGKKRRQAIELSFSFAL